jgi:RecA/RadA recombinase
MNTKVEQLKRAMRKQPKSVELSIKDGVSSGCTLLNLACSGRRSICFFKGHYYLYVGDSNSGKSWLCLSALAEAATNPNFADYELIYNNVEQGVLMDVRKFFGVKLADRIEMISIGFIEDFYYDIDDRLRADKPFIYILDSMDSLESKTDTEKFRKNKNLVRKGKEIKGSFGDGKAKMNSGNLRRVVADLKRTGSILIVVSQTRDAINSMFETKTRAGGHAMKFYATLEVWTSVKQHLKKNYKDKDRELGVQIKARVKKNRITGKDRLIEFPIFHSFGIDDVGACVRYLIDEKYWVKKSGQVVAPEMEFKGYESDLIKHIEDENKTSLLRKLVSEVWDEIEQACSVERRPRYD